MNRPLTGRRILVTRPLKQSGALGDAIRAHGGYPVFFPLLEISPVDDWASLSRRASQLEDYAIVIFISPNAVEFGMPELLGERVAWPGGTQVAAIGPGTVSALARQGVRNVIVPSERFDSEALLELPAFHKASLERKSILIVRGNGGRELLANTLTQRGARVDCVTCYHRSVSTDKRALQVALSGGLHALTVSSSEGLRHLTEGLDAESRNQLLSVPTFAPHERIVETAVEVGLKKVILTPPADAGIIQGLCIYFNDHGHSD